MTSPVESAMVAEDDPSLALIFATSMFAVSSVVEFRYVEFTVVIFPIVDARVLIVVAFIVPPLPYLHLFDHSQEVSVPLNI